MVDSRSAAINSHEITASWTPDYYQQQSRLGHLISMYFGLIVMAASKCIKDANYLFPRLRGPPHRDVKFIKLPLQ